MVDGRVFEAVPDGCWLGMSDVVNSTSAIAAGRYKAVNMAGAAVISAVMNATGKRDFPFVFGGDGATYVKEPGDIAAAREAAAATAAWVAEELGLELRVAGIEVGAVRAAGHDLRVARFAASHAVSYAMFAGGGVEWAEQQMKAGRSLIARAPPGTNPDLTGLSCRWQPLESRHGTILSLIVREGPSATPGGFSDAVRSLLAVLHEREQADGRPVPAAGPSYRFSPAGLDLEARATRGSSGRLGRKLALLPEALLAFVLFGTNKKLGRFDPAHYRHQTALNTDFRKFDDGLKMTVDCSVETADRIERLLADAAAREFVRYGTHRQKAAQMTCIVPSPLTDDHLHFIDGADGGYAAAAARMR